jgi:hypothetical protein
LSVSSARLEITFLFCVFNHFGARAFHQLVLTFPGTRTGHFTAAGGLWSRVSRSAGGDSRWNCISQ